MVSLKRQTEACMFCDRQLDEEELYSSVTRGAPDDDASARPADAANDITFGADAVSDTSSKPASSSGREPAEGPRRAAWGNAGAGVAVVSGRFGPFSYFACSFSCNIAAGVALTLRLHVRLLGCCWKASMEHPCYKKQHGAMR